MSGTIGRSFGGLSPLATLYYASRDRRQEHPERHLKSFTGILRADAYGYDPLFKVDCDPNPLKQALGWAHPRRKFFVLAYMPQTPDVERTPRRCPQWHWKPSNGSTPCSISGGRSKGVRLINAWNVASWKACRSSMICRPGFKRAGKALTQFSGRRDDRLHAQALARLHVIPEGWPDLPDKQCGPAKA